MRQRIIVILSVTITVLAIGGCSVPNTSNVSIQYLTPQDIPGVYVRHFEAFYTHSILVLKPDGTYKEVAIAFDMEVYENSNVWHAQTIDEGVEVVLENSLLFSPGLPPPRKHDLRLRAIGPRRRIFDLDDPLDPDAANYLTKTEQ